jgi:ABC-type sugar transport system permease subunit
MITRKRTRRVFFRVAALGAVAAAMGWIVFFVAVAVTAVQLRLFRFGEQRQGCH